MCAGGSAAGGDGLGGLLDRRAVGVVVRAGQGAGQEGDLGGLLRAEGEPRAQLGIVVEGGLLGEGVGDVEQGARGGHGDGTTGLQGLQGVQRGAEVRAPDVAAVDDSGDEQLLALPGREEFRVRGGGGVGAALVGATGDEVDADGCDACSGEGADGDIAVTEVGLDQQLGRAGGGGRGGGEALVGGAGAGEQFLTAGGIARDVGDQPGLVELDPGDARLGEVADEGDVGLGDRVQVVQRVGTVGGARERQVGQRTDDHGADREPARGQFLHVGDERRVVELEPGVRGEFGDDVVVVGVEPLGHGRRGELGGSARRGEVAVDVGRQIVAVTGALVVRDVADPGGEHAEQRRGVQDLVVEAASDGGDGVETGGDEVRRGVPGQNTGGLREIGACRGVAPVGFQCLLQLALRSDAGHTCDGGGNRVAHDGWRVLCVRLEQMRCSTAGAARGGLRP